MQQSNLLKVDQKLSNERFAVSESMQAGDLVFCFEKGIRFVSMDEVFFKLSLNNV